MIDANVKKSAKERDRQYALLGARIVGDFGATLAIPVVLLALAGKALDTRFGTRPLFLIAGFALAAVLSGTSVVRKAKRYGKAYEELSKK
jgi:F0F1-type ATP synthase assembly protein I